jgi:hypothetical protein
VRETLLGTSESAIGCGDPRGFPGVSRNGRHARSYKQPRALFLSQRRQARQEIQLMVIFLCDLGVLGERKWI